jgi:hypothetical protein
MNDTGLYNKAHLSFQTGLTHDRENKELKDGLRRASAEVMKLVTSDEIMKETVARAAADPEPRAILTDPIIQRLLNVSSSRPAAAAAYLIDEGVAAAKVQKLVDAGLISPQKRSTER